MKVLAIPIKSQDLKPGDLFSTYGPDYWDNVDLRESIGEKAWIRTNSPTPVSQTDMPVYKLLIAQREGEKCTSSG